MRLSRSSFSASACQALSFWPRMSSSAAYFSKARESENVPVDYTRVKNVKKPAGAKPGMVIYDHYSTAVVTPDAALAEKLREG